jgi:hypothetical protein
MIWSKPLFSTETGVPILPSFSTETSRKTRFREGRTDITTDKKARQTWQAAP